MAHMVLLCMSTTVVDVTLELNVYATGYTKMTSQYMGHYGEKYSHIYKQQPTQCKLYSDYVFHMLGHKSLYKLR